MSDSSTPQDEPDTEPTPVHADVPLEVLEDDEDVPPRPEESVADAPPVA